MSIKYGELTIDHNKETTLFNNLSMWLGYEQRATKLSKLVFLFEDANVSVKPPAKSIKLVLPNAPIKFLLFMFFNI
jgi:hypothetical protein